MSIQTNKLKKIIALSMAMSIMITPITTVEVSAKQKLSEKQKMTADKIAAYVDARWDKYGVLPSVAVAQAYVESSLGKRCAGFNLWGIASGAESYSSLHAGAHRYMEVINNGYYPGAPGEKNYKKQLQKILAGGYCQPVGNYYENAMYGYRNHNFEKYDKALFTRLKKEKEEKKKEKLLAKKEREEEERYLREMSTPYEPFKIVQDPTIPEGMAYANTECIRGGCIMVYTKDKKTFLGVCEVFEDNSLIGNTIRINLPEISDNSVQLKVYENAVG